MSTTKKHVPRRNPLEDTLSASIPKKLKRSVQGRGQLLDRPMSLLLRAAIEYHEKTGWVNALNPEGVPVAILSKPLEQRLQRWVDSGDDLEQL